VGCTFTDLIFPFFLFIAGVAMWFSFRNVVRDDRWTLLRKILRRAGLIFLVGLFISWFPFYDQTLEKLHWLGVLQRISVSYVIASLICISCGRKWVAAAAALLLLGYWGLIAISGGDEPFARDVVFDRGIDFVAFRSCLTSAVPIMIGYLTLRFEIIFLPDQCWPCLDFTRQDLGTRIPDHQKPFVVEQLRDLHGRHRHCPVYPLPVDH
jgi:hypothetical protein